MRGTSSPLGIDEPDQSLDVSYLYDENPGRKVNWRATSAVVLVLLFAGFFAYVWRQYPSWNTKIVKAPQEQAKLLAKGSAGALRLDQPSAAASVNPQPPAESRHTAEPPKDNATPDAEPSTNRSTSGSQEKAVPTENVSPDSSDNSKGGAAEPHNSPSRPDHASSRAVQGNPAAPEVDPGAEQYRQGMAYLEGHGAPHSCSPAVALLNSAAGKGNSKAATQLGAMYATGHCVSLDRPTAYRWFSSALAEHHSALTEHNRQMLWSEMSDSERQRALAQSR
jgi:TPR repeat protein